MRRTLLIVATAWAAGCGSPHATPDAADEAQPCQATFSGNFPEESTGFDNCPMIAADTDGHQQLTFTLPASTLATNFAIAVDLGATPTPGTFSSETVTTWSVLAIQTVGSGDCAFSAGSAAVPTGSFTLALDAVDPVAGTTHGTLTILAYVLALLGTDCGAGDTETVQIMF